MSKAYPPASKNGLGPCGSEEEGGGCGWEKPADFSGPDNVNASSSES